MMRGPAVALAAFICLSAVDAAADCPARFSGCEEPPPMPNPKPTPPVPVPPSGQRDPCAALVSVRQGVVTLQIEDPVRAGQTFQATIDNIVYAARFGADGKARLEAPIFHTVAEVLWPGAAGSACRRSGVLFDDFASAYEAALIWEGDYELNLRVVEPDGGFESATGFITPERPNLDVSAGHGELRKFGVAAPGASRVWLYSIPFGTRPSGEFYFWVEFASRGNPARPPYCEGQAYPTAEFQLRVIDNGSANPLAKQIIPSVPCGYSFPSLEKEWRKIRP